MRKDAETMRDSGRREKVREGRDLRLKNKGCKSQRKEMEGLCHWKSSRKLPGLRSQGLRQHRLENSNASCSQGLRIPRATTFVAFVLRLPAPKACESWN
jgi:hypothetical protein